MTTWVSLRAIARELGVGRSAAASAIRSGRIRSRQIPGCRVQYAREDAATLASKSEAGPPRPAEYRRHRG